MNVLIDTNVALDYALQVYSPEEFLEAMKQ